MNLNSLNKKSMVGKLNFNLFLSNLKNNSLPMRYHNETNKQANKIMFFLNKVSHRKNKVKISKVIPLRDRGGLQRREM
jgi:hypothetical protein